MIGAIIAAGRGTRLCQSGITVPKQMVKIGGVPLIGRQVAEFERAGIRKVHIILNSSVFGLCTAYLKEAFAGMAIHAFSKDTKSSAESFIEVLKEVLKRAGQEAADHEQVLVSTVDSIYAPGTLGRFRGQVEEMGEEQALFLGITSHVDDEKPLYCRLGQGGRVMELGGGLKEGPVTCGLYCLPASWAQAASGRSFSALRQFLAGLIHDGRPAYGIDVGKVIDVDRPEDIEAAEKFLIHLEEVGENGGRAHGEGVR